MLLSLLENTANYTTAWVQKRPHITQGFGLTPYALTGAYGYDKEGNPKPHTGIDYRANIGTPIVAPMDGQIVVIDSGDSGYGLHIRIRNSYKEMECVIAHMSSTVVSTLGVVKYGDVIGFSGNSGVSTAPHIHFGTRKIVPTELDIWNWPIKNYDSIYYGYFDPSEYLITFKGTLKENSITD